MILLVFGLLLWSMVHLMPAVAPKFKLLLISKLSEKGYKLVFTLIVFLSIISIVIGWRNTEPQFLYQLNGVAHTLFIGLNIIAFILIGAAKYPTRIKRLIRHPQLTGVFLWSLAHLLLNGDSRSVLLFGVMGLWAIVEMILISKREGKWLKPETPLLSREIRGLGVSLVIIVVIVFIHPYITGVSIH